MKKAILVLLTIVVSMFLFVGCQKIELSEEEEKLFVAYCVDCVLKYDYDYQDKLLKVPEISTDEEVTDSTEGNEGDEETTAGGNIGGDEKPTQNGGSDDVGEVSMTEIMGINGISFDVTGFQVTKKYSAGNDEGAMTATEGKKLLVVEISAKNNNSSATSLNMIKQDIKFTAVVNSNKKMNPQRWVWADGCTLNLFVGEFAAGEEKDFVMAFQVDESLEVNSIRLLIKKGENEGYIKVK